MKNGYSDIRLRRLRQHTALLRLIGQDFPGPNHFIWPVFVTDSTIEKVEIPHLPNQYRYSLNGLKVVLEKISKDGIGGILIFGVPHVHQEKDSYGNFASNERGIVHSAIRMVRNYYPQLLVFADVCLCAYTDHGHCGIVLQNGEIGNDESCNRLAEIALSYAQAGAHGVAPSAMMDGQVSIIRKYLDTHLFKNTLILSYSTKFASSLYGPFRNAQNSSPTGGDRKSYQAPYTDSHQALRESLLDEYEGADMLMIKPSLFYLDIVFQLRQQTHVPIAVYNVSGEYTMLVGLAEKGLGKIQDLVQESISAMHRAGADIIISYWANQYPEIVNT